MPWIFVDSSNDLVPDSYWHPAKFLNRLTLIREAYDFFQEMPFLLVVIKKLA